MAEPLAANLETEAASCQEGDAKPQQAPTSWKITLPDIAQRPKKEREEKKTKPAEKRVQKNVKKSSTSGSSSSDSRSDSDTEEDREGERSKKGPMGLPRKSKPGRASDEDDEDSPVVRVSKKPLGLTDGAGADAWMAMRKAVVTGGSEINQRLPGGRTWKLIADERLLSAGKLRQCLLDMWTLLGVVTALVASFAVDGITNSASSFASFEEVSGNLTLCVVGTATCVDIKDLYKVYGLLVSTGCLLSILALAMSMLFYSYLLIQPVSRTRWFVRKNINLFPSTFLLVILAMALVIAGVCVQCVAAFGPAIGYTVVGLGVVVLFFVLWLIWRLERQTKFALKKYGQKQQRKASRKLKSMADVVEELQDT